jgi:hypothetical protein
LFGEAEVTNSAVAVAASNLAKDFSCTFCCDVLQGT